MHIYAYICIHVCVYIHVCMHIYIYILTHSTGILIITTQRGGRIGKVQASRAGNREFNFQSSQTNNLQNVYLSFSSLVLGINRIGQTETASLSVSIM